MKTVIIDVRTPKEFSECSIPGAVNIPLDEKNLEAFNTYKDFHICLVCQSGNRAESALVKLKESGYEHVSMLNKHMIHIEENSEAKGWSVDRQFRLVLGIFIGLFMIGYYLGQVWVWAILVIIISGLTYSAITDNCYLKMFIASMPWNRQKQNT